MDTNDNARANLPDDVVVLGVASVETKGGPLAGEEIGGPNVLGISEE
ncbi:benenodin family lasso peptide [Xanthomonas sp. AmX2]|nr:benenodin family lasso peptide [Xanthomonas sp.]MBN6150769.1 benenodin family lasso peptide [Xanthomonas sp.]